MLVVFLGCNEIIDAQDAIEGADSTNNEEIIVLNASQTPTSKGLHKETLKGSDPFNNEEGIVLDNKLTRRSLSLHDFGEAAAKKSFVPNECTSLLDSVEPPTCKSVGKRTAIVDEIDVSAIKETKIACVKTKNSK
jgi:hypothetical protein